MRSRLTRGDSECWCYTVFAMLSILTGPVGVPPHAGGLSVHTWSGDNARSWITNSVKPSPPTTRLRLPFTLAESLVAMADHSDWEIAHAYLAERPAAQIFGVRRVRWRAKR
jgi:hypothetical protein